MKNASVENTSAKSKAIKVCFEPIFPLQPLNPQVSSYQKIAHFISKIKGAIQRT